MTLGVGEWWEKKNYENNRSSVRSPGGKMRAVRLGSANATRQLLSGTTMCVLAGERFLHEQLDVCVGLEYSI
jgi:hypothetical protein